jgi:hypothetical protein
MVKHEKHVNARDYHNETIPSISWSINFINFLLCCRVYRMSLSKVIRPVRITHPGKKCICYKGNNKNRNISVQFQHFLRLSIHVRDYYIKERPSVNKYTNCVDEIWIIKQIEQYLLTKRSGSVIIREKVDLECYLSDPHIQSTKLHHYERNHFDHLSATYSIVNHFN